MKKIILFLIILCMIIFSCSFLDQQDHNNIGVGIENENVSMETQGDIENPVILEGAQYPADMYSGERFHAVRKHQYNNVPENVVFEDDKFYYVREPGGGTREIVCIMLGHPYGPGIDVYRLICYDFEDIEYIKA